MSNEKSLNTYSVTPFRVSNFKTSPFSITPYTLTPFQQNPYKLNNYNVQPFDLTPFLKYPFNNDDNDKLWTPLERIQYEQYMRSQLPSKKARDYFKKQRDYQEYLKNKREQEEIQAQQAKEESMLADHNKGTEINSLRDAVLGMFNPHMEHAIEEIPEYLGLLNLIPDTLSYWWKFYFKPTLSGKPLTTLINVLGGATELIDALTLTTPTKAVIQALTYGDDVWENLQAATIGTEEGINNFDWDTGDAGTDLIYEILSDPTTYIFLIGTVKTLITTGIKTLGKGAAKATLKTSAKVAQETAEGVTEQAAKTIGRELAENISKAVGKEITEESIERSTVRGFKELWKITRSGWDKTDAYGQVVKKSMTKEVKGFSQKANAVRDLLKINQWDSFKNLDAAFDNAFVKKLIVLNKLDPKSADTILDIVRKSGINKTVTDIMQDTYKKVTSNILVSLHNKLEYVDDLLSSTVIKASLTPIPIYPVYRSLRKGALYKSLLKQSVKGNQQVLINKFKATAKKPGSFINKTNVTDIETKILKNLVKGDNVEPLLKQNAIQNALIEFGTALSDFIYLARHTILNNTKLTAAQKRSMLLENLQAISSKIKSKKDLINYLKEAEQKINKAKIKHTAQTGIQQYIDEFQRIFRYIDLQDKAEKAAKKLSVKHVEYQHAKHLLDVANKASQQGHNKTWVNKIIRHTQGKPTVDFITQTLKNFVDLDQAQVTFTTILDFLKKKQYTQLERNLKKLVENILQSKTRRELVINIKAFISKINELNKEISQSFEELAGLELTEELETLLNNTAFQTQLKAILSVKDPKTHQIYREALSVLEEQQKLQKKIATFAREIKSTNIQEPIKSQAQRGIKTIQVLHEAKKEAFKSNIELKTDSEEVQKGIKYVKDLFKNINEQDGGLDELYKKHKQELQDLGVELQEISIGSSSPENTYIGQILEDIYQDLQAIQGLIVEHQHGNMEGKLYKFWYRRLQDKVQDLSNDYLVYKNILQNKLDPERLAYAQAQSVVNRFWQAVPWIEEVVFPKRTALNTLVSELTTKTEPALIELVREVMDKGLEKISITKRTKLNELLTKHNASLDEIKKILEEIDKVKEAPMDINAISDTDLLDLIRAKIKQAQKTNNTAEAKTYIKQYKDAIKVINNTSDQGAKVFTLDNLVDHTLAQIDFKYEYQQTMLDKLNTVFTLGKLSKEARSAMLNNLQHLQEFYQDEAMIELLSSVFTPEVLSKLRPAEQRIVVAFARLRDGLANKELFDKTIDLVVSGISDKRQRQILKDAIMTTVQNLALQDVNDLNANQIMSQILDSIEGYTNSFKVGRKPKSMDYLRKTYGIKTDTVDKVADELKRAGIVLDDFEKEHSALYDAASQILVWEHEHSSATKFTGVMMDIETAGVLDKYGNPTGAITEIALVTRGEDGKLKVLGHFKVKDTEERVRLLYTNTSDVAYKMGLEPEEQILKYVSDSEVITEENIVRQAFEVLSGLPEGTEVHTYNGSRFDVLYLEARARSLKIGNIPKHRDPKYLTEIEILEQSFQDIFENLEWIDDLAEKNKHLYSTPPDVYIKLRQAIADHLQRQLELQKYNTITDAAGNVINAQKIRFFTEVEGSFIKEIIDTLQEDKVNVPLVEYVLNMQQGLNIPEITENLEDYIDLGTEELEEAVVMADPTILLTQLQELRINPDPRAFDGTVRKHLINIKEELLDTLSDIKFTHEYLRGFPIIEDVYNVQNKRFSESLAKKLFKAWVAEQTKLGVDVTPYLKGAKHNRYFTNLTAMINFEGQTAIAYKNFRPELLRLIDIAPILKHSDKFGESTTLALREQLDPYLRRLRQEANRAKNYGVMETYYTEAMQMLEFLKDNAYRLELEVIKLDSVSKREAWAQLQILWDRINIDKNYYINAKDLDKKLRELNPELAALLDQKVIYFDINLKDTELRCNINEAILDVKCRDYYNVVSQGAELDRLDKALKEHQVYGNTPKSLIYKMRNLINLRKQAYTKEGYSTKTVAQYARIGREFTDIIYSYSLFNKLTSTPEELLSAILYDTPNRTLYIARPTTDKVFGTTRLFHSFLKRADEFKAFGINIKYDEVQNALEITLDKTLDIRKSENATDTFKWLVNGTEIEPVSYPMLTKEVFEKGYGRKIHQDYRDALYEAYQEIVSADPRYAGRTGALIVIENDRVVVEGLTENTIIDFAQDATEYRPYFNEAWVGTYADLQGRIGPRYADAFYSLDSMATRITKNSLNRNNYITSIVNTGFNLQDELINNIPLDQLSDYLNRNPDLVVAYLKTDKHAIEGVTLEVLHKIDVETLGIVKETGSAFIIPWNTYTSIARNFNKYTYDNRLVEAWYKLMQLYKKAWLMSPGVIIRNAIDSTIKNFFEGGSPDQTVKSYAEAYKLLIQFDEITKEITRLDPAQAFRFDNAVSYFIKNEPGMDKETYMFLYQLMNDMGINTMYTMTDGLFGAFMKPMTMIERVSRLSMFLNLQGQGKRYAEILRKIADTHFTYDLSESLGFIKALLPFHTYTFSNLNYIMHLIEENPSVLAHYLNIYAAMWNLDNIDHEELEENTSLQYQILNGNIPLSFFGYEDKEVERIINTKYGEQVQKVKHNAVIKVGSSILDGLNSFINPYQSFMDKIAPPAKIVMDTMTEYLATAVGNFSAGTWYDYQDAENRYERGLGSASLQRMVEDPTAILDSLPIVDVAKQRFFHKEGDQYKFGSTTGQRTQNPVLDVLGMAGIVGATSRWGEFAPRPKQTYRRKTTTKSSGYKYYRSARTYNSRYRFNKNDLYLYNILHPNAQHRAFNRLQSIPQYLFSNMGVNSRGKSKVASWMSMSPDYRRKFNLRRLARM